MKWYVLAQQMEHWPTANGRRRKGKLVSERAKEQTKEGESEGVNEGVRFFECHPASNYQLKVSNRNTRTRCEICSKSTIKTQEQCLWHCCGVFIVNTLLLTYFILSSTVPIVNFEHVITGRAHSFLNKVISSLPFWNILDW